jgi:hypothetical protein
VASIADIAVGSGWEEVQPLGKGGQSEVFLVRSPDRVRERRDCVEQMWRALEQSQFDKFANFSRDYSRPDNDSELGAMKVFKITRGASWIMRLTPQREKCGDSRMS